LRAATAAGDDEVLPGHPDALEDQRSVGGYGDRAGQHVNRDGVVTVGVRRGGTWYVSNVLGGATSSSFLYGYSTDRPVVWR
jgi:hypothetical protein